MQLKDPFIYILSWTFTTLTIINQIDNFLPILTASLSALLSVSGIVLNFKKIISNHKNKKQNEENF